MLLTMMIHTTVTDSCFPSCFSLPKKKITEQLFGDVLLFNQCYSNHCKFYQKVIGMWCCFSWATATTDSLLVRRRPRCAATTAAAAAVLLQQLQST
jgi:hypothetical protein